MHGSHGDGINFEAHSEQFGGNSSVGTVRWDQFGGSCSVARTVGWDQFGGIRKQFGGISSGGSVVWGAEFGTVRGNISEISP